MDWMLPIDLKKLNPPVTYRDKIMLIGSCFTEHIGNALADLKFSICQNPNGILFGPDAVCKSVAAYIRNQPYTPADLFQWNEVWSSWQHHSRYAHTDAAKAVQQINQSQQEAHDFLRQADWLIITLGSSFTYTLAAEAAKGNLETGDSVANCHRAPGQWFEKQMLETDAIENMLRGSIDQLRSFNKSLKILFTVSPVRHIRDGVVANNRSKARLLEAVHRIVDRCEEAHYFPAYELVIDVLRDYRFYDIDLVHPNYPATEFVLEKFAESCIDPASRELMQEIRKIVIARKHRPFQPETKAHQQFLSSHFEKTKMLQEKYPFLDLGAELVYFSQT